MQEEEDYDIQSMNNKKVTINMFSYFKELEKDISTHKRWLYCLINTIKEDQTSTVTIESPELMNITKLVNYYHQCLIQKTIK